MNDLKHENPEKAAAWLFNRLENCQADYRNDYLEEITEYDGLCSFCGEEPYDKIRWTPEGVQRYLCPACAAGYSDLLEEDPYSEM